MDPSGVLLALEEQKKWRERKKRIEERLKQLGRRKVYLLREIERARKNMSDIRGLVWGLKDQISPRVEPGPLTIHPR